MRKCSDKFMEGGLLLHDHSSNSYALVKTWLNTAISNENILCPNMLIFAFTITSQFVEMEGYCSA